MISAEIIVFLSYKNSSKKWTVKLSRFLVVMQQIALMIFEINSWIIQEAKKLAGTVRRLIRYL